VARLKPFRAVRFDPERAGPLEDLVAPPHDVVTPDVLERLLAASPHNVIRLTRPESATAAGELYRAWQDEGVLVREDQPAVWLLEETFADPEGEPRTRRSLVARLRVTPYGEGDVYPHERTFVRHKRARADLLREVGAKLSPILLMHGGPGPGRPGGEPALDVEFDGVRNRLWRVTDPDAIAAAIDAVRPPFVIADGHHRYENVLEFHEAEGTEESAYLLAALVARDDPGLLIRPTHRLAAEPLPHLPFATTELGDGAAEALARLADAPRGRPAFARLRAEDSVLVEAEPLGGAAGALDTAVLDLQGVRYTADAGDAERAVRAGEADAAFLVRAPTVAEVEAVALAGETMPQKSTYFAPKLTSGLLIAPFDE
jgi:uncharacterized protein (DUF1015 family)